jgi:lipopolysaccharide export system protein LptA
LAGILLCLLAGAAQAERADRERPVHVEADQVSLDDARQVGVFTGNVVMTQGTLSISGDQVVATQNAQGFEHGTVSGKPAKFRQKREGTDEYVEGSGARIEYDAASGIMNIYGQAQVKRGQAEVRGEHITYDLNTEVFQASGESAPAQNKGDGRIHLVIPPRAASAVAPSEPLPIRPDTRMIKQDEKP